jgi:hypothetical protein
VKKTPVLLGIIFFAIVIGVIVYSSMGLSQARVQVCMQFNGRTNCGTASGQNRGFALRTATANACAVISGGVGDTIACEQSTPVSVKWLK